MENLLRNPSTIDWVTILLFISLLFLALAKQLFYSRFLNYIILPFNNKYIFMYNRRDSLGNWFQIFLTIFQLINCTLFVYLVQGILWGHPQEHQPKSFLIICAFIVGFFLLKTSLQLFSGYIFGSNKVMSQVIFKKLSYFNYSGLVMFLANILLSFVAKDSHIVAIGAILLILIINIIGWVTAIQNHQKYIAPNFFYFILYLCTLEIAPLIIIGDYLNY